VSDLQTNRKKGRSIAEFAVAIWFFLLPVTGAWCGNTQICETSRTVQSTCTVLQDSLKPGFFSMQYTYSSLRPPLPALQPLTPHSPSIVQSVAPVLSERPVRPRNETTVIQPESTGEKHEKLPPLIENFLQIFNNGKNPFASNKIILIKDAPFLRSYFSIYIYIYTDFDEIDAFESLKNIGTIVPKLNLTIRLAI
jgi:hypothetical protein